MLFSMVSAQETCHQIFLWFTYKRPKCYVAKTQHLSLQLNLHRLYLHQLVANTVHYLFLIKTTLTSRNDMSDSPNLYFDCIGFAKVAPATINHS